MDYSNLSASQRGNIIPQAQRYIQQQTGSGKSAPQVYMMPGGQYTTQIPQSLLSPQEISQISNQPNQDSSNVVPGTVWALPGGGFTPKEPSAAGYAPAKSGGGGKSFFDFVPYIADVAATLTGNPELIPAIHGVYSGVKTGVDTGNPLSGLLSGAANAAGTYAGGKLGGAFLGPELSSIGSSVDSASGATVPGFLGKTFGQTFGDFAGNSIGGQTLGNLVGTGIGGFAGGSAGDMVGGMASNLVNPPNPGNQQSFGFSPSQQPGMGLPQSLSQFAGLNPNQQASNIATKGVYGGGNGPDETNYFMNLMNRSLFNNGQLANDTSGINPVSMNYLNQLGVSGSSPTDLAKGISSYNT